MSFLRRKISIDLEEKNKSRSIQIEVKKPTFQGWSSPTTGSWCVFIIRRNLFFQVPRWPMFPVAQVPR